ncbi:MAG: ABC transporter permease, partial [Candidatus Bathyarchaeia archaeon]
LAVILQSPPDSVQSRPSRVSSVSGLRRVLKGRLKVENVLFLLPLGVLFIAWELSLRFDMLNFSNVPLPSQVFLELSFNALNPVFMWKIFLSFATLMTGLVIGLVLALPIAIFTGLKGKVDATITPVVMLAGALPDLALLPLFVLWFGPGATAAIFLATIASFLPIYFTVREGVKDMPKDYFHVASVYGSGRLNIYRKIIFPSTVPQIVTGTRLAFDFVWEIVLAIEIFAQVSGIGSFINLSVEQGSVTSAFAGIFMIGIIAIAFDRLVFYRLETRIRRWHE